MFLPDHFRSLIMDKRTLYDTRITITNVLRLVKDYEIVSDEDAINNIVALFFGATSGKVFETLENSTFHLKEVSVGVVSLNCSQNYLKMWVKYGDTMRSLLELLYPEVDGDVFEELSTTLLSYLHCLRKISHQQISRPLVRETELYLRNNPRPKLDNFLSCVTRISDGQVFAAIDLLYHLHAEVLTSEDFELNVKCTSHLINVMYKHLDVRNVDMKNIVWFLFVNIIRPSLAYFESLFLDGRALDPREEFLFDLSYDGYTDEICIDDKFWDDCLKLRGKEDSAPELFKPFIGKIILGAKSRVLFNACTGGKVPATASPQKETLFDHFWANFLELFKRTKEKPSQSNEMPKKVCSGPLKDIALDSFPNPTIYDTVFFDISSQFSELPHLPQDHVDSVIETEYELEKYHELPTETIVPLKLAIERALDITFSKYADDASKELLNEFRPQYLTHLRVFFDYYLLHQSSHSISLFLNSLFEKVSNVQETGFVRFTDHYFEDSERVRICFTYEANLTTDPMKVIECLHLYYEGMEPFSQVLLNADMRQVYDNALHFLVVLKYSKWCLETLQYTQTIGDRTRKQGSGGEEALFQHQLYIIKFKILSVINNLHYYIMLKIDEEICALTTSTEEAANFEELRTALAKNLKGICRYTFQGIAGYNGLVFKIYQTVAKIRKMWDLRSWNQNNNFDLKREAELLRRSVLKLEAVSNCVYGPMRE